MEVMIPYSLYTSHGSFNAAQLQGIPSKFLFFPDETHFVPTPKRHSLEREFMDG
jgi:hypothetical protein